MLCVTLLTARHGHRQLKSARAAEERKAAPWKLSFQGAFGRARCLTCFPTIPSATNSRSVPLFLFSVRQVYVPSVTPPNEPSTLSRLYLSGGWNTETQFNDLHILDLETMAWSAVLTATADKWGPPRYGTLGAKRSEYVLVREHAPTSEGLLSNECCRGPLRVLASRA